MKAMRRENKSAPSKWALEKAQKWLSHAHGEEECPNDGVVCLALEFDAIRRERDKVTEKLAEATDLQAALRNACDEAAIECHPSNTSSRAVLTGTEVARIFERHLTPVFEALVERIKALSKAESVDKVAKPTVGNKCEHCGTDVYVISGGFWVHTLNGISRCPDKSALECAEIFGGDAMFGPANLEEAKRYRYDSGYEYQPSYCAADRKFGNLQEYRGIISSQCTRKPGHGPDGIFCKQHARMREGKR